MRASISGDGTITAKPSARVPVATGVVIEMVLDPTVAFTPMVMLTTISLELFTVKSFTVMPGPKLTEPALVKQSPVIVTSSVCP